LAEALHRIGEPAAACDELTAALQIAVKISNTFEQAAIHRELAENHHATGENQQARRHWEQALDLYTRQGMPEADQIQAQLDAQEADRAFKIYPSRT
jgi:tetratricopeptide (TPR) repeat protein